MGVNCDKGVFNLEGLVTVQGYVTRFGDAVLGFVYDFGEIWSS